MIILYMIKNEFNYNTTYLGHIIIIPFLKIIQILYMILNLLVEYYKCNISITIY